MAKAAVITGGGRGIGAATAEVLAESGFAVALAARTESELKETADRVRQKGGTVAWMRCDVSKDEEVAELFASVDELWGRVDVLVNCAAIVRSIPFEQLEPAQWDEVLNVNLRGTFLCCREGFRRMQARGGLIVNLSSLSGVRGPEKFPGLSAYNVSKYGVLGLTEMLAVEGRPHGIRAVALSPGAVETRMLKEANPDLHATIGPEAVARIIGFLATEAGAPLSGANLELFTNA